MAGLQQLRKRLKSIRATGQLAEAMRTAATIKYSRVSKVREEFTPYADGSADMLALLGRYSTLSEPAFFFSCGSGRICRSVGTCESIFR